MSLLSDSRRTVSSVLLSRLTRYVDEITGMGSSVCISTLATDRILCSRQLLEEKRETARELLKSSRKPMIQLGK
jgi:hypothetical protein